MNALIALAVWCQPHGPVTILTTQHRRPVSSFATQPHQQHPTDTHNSSPSRQHDATTNNNSATSLGQPHVNVTTSPSSSSLDDPQQQQQHATTTTSSTTTQIQTQTLDHKKSRRATHQSSLGGHGTGAGAASCHSPTSRPSSGATSSSGPCECQFSIPSGERSLHSVDPINSELSYVSQPAPVDSSLFAPIRIACIRSLNAETYSGREGAVFFGDGLNGYVLSYMFTVYDAQSRGHRVKYTIMTMMTDRVYLVASMEYLISQFQVIASNLQAMANALYVPQQSPAARSMSYSSSHHRGSIMPENTPTKKGRPLTEVLAKPDIFVQLHAAFASVLSNCGQRLTERHIQGRPMTNDWCAFSADLDMTYPENEDQEATVDSLRELRRVLGLQKFNRLIWNTLVGNQVIIRGEEPRIVVEIVRSLEEILPKDCCSIILNSTTYEQSYTCNILGLDRSVAIPTDMDPNDFILLDLCLTTFTHRSSATTSLTASEHSNGNGKLTNDSPSSYQADWSTTTLHGSPSDLVGGMEKMAMDESTSKDGVTTNGSHVRPSIPGGLLYSGGGFQCQRRIYLLQAGEEPPDALNLSENEKDKSQLQTQLQSQSRQQQETPDFPLYVETVNEILDLKLPKSIEAKRLAVLREECVSKAKQFHNLYKAGCASDEADHELEVDHLVIGAGVVGLAIAEKLASRGGSTLIVDKNSAVGQETSSRNSEVIHAGLYYPEDSFKTKLCIRGNHLLYDLCEKYGIEHQRITKWVVAQTETDMAYLENLSKKAQQLLRPTTRLPGPPTYMINQKEMKSQEQHVQGKAALVSPRTGIVDVHGLMQFLEMRIEEHSGNVVLQCEVIGIERMGGRSLSGFSSARGPFRVQMTTPDGLVSVKAATVINSGGLHSDKVLQMLYDVPMQETPVRAPEPYRLYYCKGHYYGYSGPSLVSRLIYPVPDKNLTSLGTHLTLDLAGRMRFGPDVLYVDSPHDYSIDQEAAGSSEALSTVAKVIQTYLPCIEATSLYPDYTGIRPKLAGPEEPFRDFEIEHHDGFVNLAGIESPGLTSSLAIAEHVEQLLF
ncbi:hypothetical protein BGZ94_001881 [Podila epigama]|nr:hypothetical protein BGZ94_001881 [Podila epigama]